MNSALCLALSSGSEVGWNRRLLDDGARSFWGASSRRVSCLRIGAVCKFSCGGSSLRGGLSLPAADRAPGCGPVSADVSPSFPPSRVAPRGQRLRWHRSTEQAVSKLGLLSPVTILGPPHPESLRHRSPSGPLSPSTPSPRPRACRVHQLRLLPSRCCLGFNFCVALRKLPIITAAKRKQSPSTAVLQLCRLQSTAGAGLWPGTEREGVRVAASPAVRGSPRGGPGRGCLEHPLSKIVTNEAFGEI